MSEFDGLVAIVTGAASGIGAATAQLLAERGARVAAFDRVEQPGSPHFTQLVDVTDSADVDRAVAAVAAEFGGIDIVINNAGIGAVGNVAGNTDEEWLKVFDVNVFGVVRVSRAALPWLRESSSAAIVNTCSIVAVVGVPERVLYSASKGAVGTLTLAMAADHVLEDITVNAVLPGTADTPWVSRLLADSGDAVVAADRLRRRQPMGRLVTADEIANAIAYLASPNARSTTGTLLRVDGGMGGIRIAEAAK